jgi:hypothetical protein
LACLLGLVKGPFGQNNCAALRNTGQDIQGIFAAGRGTSRRQNAWLWSEMLSNVHAMIRKLASGKYRLYSRKKNPKTGQRRNLGTFSTRTAAKKHERAVQFYKRH